MPRKLTCRLVGWGGGKEAAGGAECEVQFVTCSICLPCCAQYASREDGTFEMTQPPPNSPAAATAHHVGVPAKGKWAGWWMGKDGMGWLNGDYAAKASGSSRAQPAEQRCRLHGRRNIPTPCSLALLPAHERTYSASLRSPQAGQQRRLRLQLVQNGDGQAQRALRVAGGGHVAHNQYLDGHLRREPLRQVHLNKEAVDSSAQQ